MKQEITIKNTGRHALTGPVALQVNGLLAGDKLSNASGSDDGDPYRDILTSGETLAPNHSLSVTLDFTIDGNGPRNFQNIYKNIDADARHLSKQELRDGSPRFLNDLA